MESFSEFSLEIALWLQSNFPQLEPLFNGFHVLGKYEFYLVAIVVVYWCLNKRLGATLAYLMSLSGTINSLLKHALHDPRPFWNNPNLALKEEYSYGVPSGHAQNATVFYGTLGLWFRRGWVWLLSIVMILLMALSRIYLGVHDLEDVLAGIVVGILILISYYLWTRFGEAWFSNRILGQRLLIATILPLLLAALYIAALLLTSKPGSDVPWFGFVEEAEMESFKNMTLSFVGLIGMSVGILLERSRVRFLVDGPLWKRLLRLLVGLVPILLLWFGIGSYFPDDPAAVEIALNGVTFLLISLWIAYYGPLVFVRLGLAESTAEPESYISPKKV